MQLLGPGPGAQGVRPGLFAAQLRLVAGAADVVHEVPQAGLVDPSPADPLQQLPGMVLLQPNGLQMDLDRALVDHRLVVVDGGGPEVAAIAGEVGVPAGNRSPSLRVLGAVLGTAPALFAARRGLVELAFSHDPDVTPPPAGRASRADVSIGVRMWNNWAMEPFDVRALEALLERSRSVRAESGRIGVRYTELHDRVGREWRRSLTETTAAVDSQTAEHPVMLARLDRLSRRVGRSPEIEHAKSLLADRYGISRGEAFSILRTVSSRSNRKLRDVAAGVIDEEAGGRDANLNPSG